MRGRSWQSDDVRLHHRLDDLGERRAVFHLSDETVGGWQAAMVGLSPSSDRRLPHADRR